MTKKNETQRRPRNWPQILDVKLPLVHLVLRWFHQATEHLQVFLLRNPVAAWLMTKYKPCAKALCFFVSVTNGLHSNLRGHLCWLWCSSYKLWFSMSSHYLRGMVLQCTTCVMKPSCWYCKNRSWRVMWVAIQHVRGMTHVQWGWNKPAKLEKSEPPVVWTAVLSESSWVQGPSWESEHLPASLVPMFHCPAWWRSYPNYMPWNSKKLENYIYGATYILIFQQLNFQKTKK